MKIQVTYSDKDKTFHEITDLYFEEGTISWAQVNGDFPSYDEEYIKEIILDGEQVYVDEKYEHELKEEHSIFISELFEEEVNKMKNDDVHPDQLRMDL